jgi:hypothetical protein
VSKKILGIALARRSGLRCQVGIPGIGTGARPRHDRGGTFRRASASALGGHRGQLAAGAVEAQVRHGAHQNQTDRLTATLIPTTPRKIIFGHTALDTDVRYQAFTGTNQEYLEMIVCHASHEVHSIDELWLDNELAWNGSVQGRYVGYLTVTTRTSAPTPTALRSTATGRSTAP